MWWGRNSLGWHGNSGAQVMRAGDWRPSLVCEDCLESETFQSELAVRRGAQTLGTELYLNIKGAYLIGFEVDCYQGHP